MSASVVSPDFLPPSAALSIWLTRLKQGTPLEMRYCLSLGRKSLVYFESLDEAADHDQVGNL